MSKNTSNSDFDLNSLAECAECTCFNTRKAARVLTQLYDDAFRGLGIRGTQFSFLVHAASYGPVTVTKLADIMLMDRTTLARNLGPLEKNGYLSVEPGKDRRQRVVSITEKGKSALAEALPVWKETQEKVKGTMGHDRWGALMGSLSGLVAAAGGIQRIASAGE